jgi:hypothetical protein
VGSVPWQAMVWFTAFFQVWTPAAWAGETADRMSEPPDAMAAPVFTACPARLVFSLLHPCSCWGLATCRLLG